MWSNNTDEASLIYVSVFYANDTKSSITDC